MSKYKISELEGALLDAAVAKGEGMVFDIIDHIPLMDAAPPSWCKADGNRFEPSVCWSHGGPIIERDHIFLQPPSSEHHCGGSAPGWKQFNFWRATVSARTRTWNTGPDDPALLVGGRVGRGEGPTALVAAMRAYVASKFGEYVELP